jgi:DNA polymerase I
MAHARYNLDVPPPEYIADDAEAIDLLRSLMTRADEEPGSVIGFDTETHALSIPTGSAKKPLDWMRDTVTFWGLSTHIGGKYRRWCLQGQHFHMFTPLLENPKVRFATWNGKYDAHISWNHGIDVWNSDFIDCMAMGYLVDENLQGNMGLKDRSAGGFIKDYSDCYEGIEPWVALNMTKYKDLFAGCIDPETGKPVKEFKTDLRHLPIDLVSDYSSLDPYATLKLYEHLTVLLDRLPMGKDYSMLDYFHDLEKHCTKTLFRMERRGLGVDVSKFKAMIPRMEEELLEVESFINQQAGRPINLNSPMQLRKLFFDPKSEGGLGLKPTKMTKGGQSTPAPSTDESVLLGLAADGVEMAQRLMRHRKVGKILSTYVRPIVVMVEHHEDGRLHPNIHQFGARTGRFSQAAPNGQNLPKPDGDEWGIRKAFIPRPGRKLLVGDYSTLEMRIMAHFSQDQNMIGAIEDGKDLHCVTVSRMHEGIPYEEAYEAKKAKDRGEADERQLYLVRLRGEDKAVGFGIIYGAGPKRISEQLEIPKKEAKEKIGDYFNAYPGVKEYMDNTIFQCQNDGFVTTLLGRRRRLPAINHQTYSLKSAAERESINSPIQGTAADITKAAMLNIERCEILNELGVEMINQIHDELVCECPEENAHIAAPIMQDYMEHPFGEGEHPLCVPTPAEVLIVDCWADAK